MNNITLNYKKLKLITWKHGVTNFNNILANGYGIIRIEIMEKRKINNGRS